MPSKRLGQFFIVNFDESSNGCFEFANTCENTSVKRPSFKLPKPAFHRIQPRGTGRGEVKLKAQVLLQPGLHAGCFMSRAVVQNQVKVLLARCFSVDLS